MSTDAHSTLPGLDDIGRNVKAEGRAARAALNRKVNPLTRQTEIVSLHGRNLTASVNEGSGLSTFARAMTLTPLVVS